MDGMVMDDCGADADGELIVWRAPKKNAGCWMVEE
jgi:hypothetical protein